MFEYQYNVFRDGEFVMSTASIADVQDLMRDVYEYELSPDVRREWQVLELVNVRDLFL